MLSKDLTEGLSLIEKLVVLLMAHATTAERKRLGLFMNYWQHVPANHKRD